MRSGTDPAVVLAETLAELRQLRADVQRDGDELVARWHGRLRRPEFDESARNLAHYLALRRRDLRSLQDRLVGLGASSLGRCEGRVLANLDAVTALLAAAGGADSGGACWDIDASVDGARQLERATAVAFGPARPGRRVRIMVTMPAEAADDPGIADGLVAAGMDVARINCAHGTHDEWRAVAAAVRDASLARGRACRICMDLCGPRARTAEVSGTEPEQRLLPGDAFWLTSGGGPPPAHDGELAVACSLPRIVSQLGPGMRVFVNEGKLGGVVEEVAGSAVLVRVDRAAPAGSRLRPDKGLNFPDTELRLDPLTAKDLADLAVVAELADIVGYSFVQRREDVARLQAELQGRTPWAKEIVLMAKIETPLAVRNLPELIVEAAGAQPMAVMIARGDLAVELGFERLTEVQEELLWVCEAARVPVVWATQVLDTFVRKGVHSRAEMTDAAMAERADCVMLNKGPYAADGVRLLDDVLARMESHQSKKSSRLRALRSW